MVDEKTSRKYPKVIWFPRSKTDMREFREVLKIAKLVQEEHHPIFFNDKLLGERMAELGLINRVGMFPEDYIKSYKGKSTGDVSYITNARMLMRIFRFFGWVRKIDSGKYVLTRRGELHTQFEGDFPDIKDSFSEEKNILTCLRGFAFYSVNDTKQNRDTKFKLRPFVWLLYNLSLEPQCIYQLIVTCFSSKRENLEEKKRIKQILKYLRENKTNLKNEFKKIGLDADNYSCVHNFYDSVKILVYIGSKLGLIEKISDPKYGKRIAGNARHLKQASIFYKLTDKGKEYLSKNKDTILIYYGEIEKVDAVNAKAIALVLGILNFELGNKKLVSVSKSYLDDLMGADTTQYFKALKNLKIEIGIINDYVSLRSPVSFNFWQSIPYEFIDKEFDVVIDRFYGDFINNKKEIKSSQLESLPKNLENYSNRFILDKEKYYALPKFKSEEDKINYVFYSGKSTSYGGQDRYATRISPTNSLLIISGDVKVDNESDCLDLITALRFPDQRLVEFINENLDQLINIFVDKSDNWEKDQHYVWIRNCFRLLGCDAIYSGSSGMLMRADVSILQPVLGGIEAKSPRENRGTVASKAIRQADHAKKQLASLYKNQKLPTVAIAIGRRITPQAIKEERDVFRPDGDPVMIISDRMLYYLTLKSIVLNIEKNDIIKLCKDYPGHFTKESVVHFFRYLKDKGRISENMLNDLIKEIKPLKLDTD